MAWNAQAGLELGAQAGNCRKASAKLLRILMFGLMTPDWCWGPWQLGCSSPVAPVVCRLLRAGHPWFIGSLCLSCTCKLTSSSHSLCFACFFFFLVYVLLFCFCYIFTYPFIFIQLKQYCFSALFFLFFPLSLLEKAMAPHSNTLAWKIPWMEMPGGLHPWGRDWATSLSLFPFMLWRRKWQPTPVFLPGDSQGRQSLVGCHLWGRTELDMTEAI